MHAVAVILLLVLLPAGAGAQDCLVLTPEQAKEIARAGGSNCAVQCRGCGCKGGPGYRNARGRCVGYERLNSECGPPPHARCVRECTAVVSGCSRPPIPLNTVKGAAAPGQ